jgi:hypothetical protein
VERDACGLGADAVDVLEEKRPNALTSTCYRVDARLLASANSAGPTLARASAPRFSETAVKKRNEEDNHRFRNAMIAAVAAVAAGVAAGVTAGLMTAR